MGHDEVLEPIRAGEDHRHASASGVRAGGPRRWSSRDAELALTLSRLLTALLEARARSDAERSERRAAFLAQTTTALAETVSKDVGLLVGRPARPS